MMHRTGLVVVGLALIAATSTAEIVEEERFDLLVPAEMVEEERFDLVASDFSLFSSENPPFITTSFESDAGDFYPSALPRESMVDDTLSLLPFPEDDPRGMEHQQLQAP